MNNPAIISDREISTLSNICRVAAERFKENANTFRSMVDAEEPQPNEAMAVRGPAAASLADQFERQAEEAFELANRLDMAEAITITDGVEDAA